MTFESFLDTKIASKEIDRYEILEDKKIEIYRNQYYIVVDKEGNIVEEIQRAGIVIKNIRITLEDGTEPEDYSQEVGTKLIVDFDVEVENGKLVQLVQIEPNLPYKTNGLEINAIFEVMCEIDHTIYTKNVTINLSKKYKIKEPEIKVSEESYTNENVIVEVDYGNVDGSYKKEISVDGGVTYNLYTKPVEIEKNTIVKARIKGKIELESELKISNIDKLLPNEFTPEIAEEISSSELKITANTTDKEDTTEEYACSGIKEYQFYVYKENSLVCESGKISENTWIASNLVVGESYTIYVDVWDQANNKRKSEEITDYQKLEVYEWAKFETEAVSYYKYKDSPAKIPQPITGGYSGSRYTAYNGDDFDENTGTWTSSGQTSFDTGTTYNDKWIAFSYSQVSYGVYRASTIYRLDKYTVNQTIVNVISATERKAYKVTENRKVKTQSPEIVKSTDLEKYPENGTKEETLSNGKKVIYQYERIKDRIALEYPIITPKEIANCALINTQNQKSWYYYDENAKPTAANALGNNAYDGDVKTVVPGGNALSYYIDVDESVWGKTLSFTYEDNGKYHQVLYLKNGTRTFLLENSTEARSAKVQMKIPETNRLELYFNEGGGLYEMKLMN